MKLTILWLVLAILETDELINLISLISNMSCEIDEVFLSTSHSGHLNISQTTLLVAVETAH